MEYQLDQFIQNLEDGLKFPRKDANYYKQMFERLQKKMLQLDCMRVDLESSLDHERQKYRTLEVEKNQMRTEMAKMGTKMEKMGTAMAKMRTEVAKMRAEVETLQIENAKLRRNQQRSGMQVPGAFSSRPSLGFPDAGFTSTDISIFNGGK